MRPRKTESGFKMKTETYQLGNGTLTLGFTKAGELWIKARDLGEAKFFEELSSWLWPRGYEITAVESFRGRFSHMKIQKRRMRGKRERV
jgi:hypothetical protein